MTTVILGAGLIGTSTAYYLSHSQAPSSIHLVEPSPKLFSSACGYAAGFLAKDWFLPSVAALGALSFEEHKTLSEQYDGRERWGYSSSTGTSYTAGQGKDGSDRRREDDWMRHDTSRAETATVGITKVRDETEPRWLRRVEGDRIEVISEEGTTAQVDPLRLSHFLLSQCLDRGVQFHHPAKAISMAKDMRNELSSVRIVSTESSNETDIPCTRLVITAGAWSPQVFQTLFADAKIKLPISSLAGYSLILRSPSWTEDDSQKGCHAVFTTDEAGYSPEIFSRIGDIYIAGLNSPSIPIPALATESEIDENAIEKLKETSRRLLDTQSSVEDLEVLRKGLCFRPITQRGPPIIARIPDQSLGEGIHTRSGAEGGVFLAAGHGPWGISLSLGTGKVMAEMLCGLPTSADISGLRL